MEGLIPYLLHAMKKQRPQHSYRSFSENSNRSYHLLNPKDSSHGSSHRRTRSEFQPPANIDFLEHRSRSVNRASASYAPPYVAGGNSSSYPFQQQGFRNKNSWMFAVCHLFVSIFSIVVIWNIITISLCFEFDCGAPSKWWTFHLLCNN